MPIQVAEVPETYKAVTRPVAHGIAQQLGKLMNLPAITQIKFNGANEEGIQPTSTLGYEGAPAKFPGGSQIDIEVRETTDNPNLYGETLFQRNALTVFHDECLGIKLRVGYTSILMTLTINVRARGRVEAEKLRDEFRLRTAMGRQQILHSATYSYSIPDDHVTLLKQFWTMREAVAGYGEDFETWIKKYASDRLTSLTDLNGDNPLPSFGETQVGIQGIFEFQIAPEAPDKAGNDGQYNFPIEYRVRFDKPVAMALDFPLVIHNQMIPANYHGEKIASGWIRQPYATPLYSDKTGEIFRELDLNRKLRPMMMSWYRYPTFDDWNPRNLPPSVNTLYSCMIAVDPNDLQSVLSLSELEGVIVDGDIRQYWATQGAKLGQLGHSPFHISLYENEEWMGDHAISVSQDLTVRTTKPMSLRNRYHLRIEVLNDLSQLTDQERLLLRTHGKAAQKILLALQAGTTYGQYVPKLVGPGIMPDQYLREAIARINTRLHPHTSGTARPMLTVQYLMLAVRRNTDAHHATGTGSSGPIDPSADPNYEQLAVSDDCCEPCNKPDCRAHDVS